MIIKSFLTGNKAAAIRLFLYLLLPEDKAVKTSCHFFLKPYEKDAKACISGTENENLKQTKDLKQKLRLNLYSPSMVMQSRLALFENCEAISILRQIKVFPNASCIAGLNIG